MAWCLQSAMVTARGMNQLATSSAEWNKAKSYDEIPGPSKWDLVNMFRKGGSLKDKSFAHIQEVFHTRYGDICKMPGILGKPDMIFIYDPADFEAVYRNEGQYPIRQGIDSADYYRKVHRKDLFSETTGLVVE